MSTGVMVAALLLNGERLISFTAAALLVPGHRGNAHVNSSTIFRWAVKGARLPDGRVVRLEAVKVGSGWRTSAEALARFSAALTSASICADPAPVSTPTPKQVGRAAAKAHDELAAALGGNP